MPADRHALSAVVARIEGDDSRLGALLGESQAEGYDHIRRLIDHWADGANRFDGPGEALFGVFCGGVLAGVGGLNHDPYVADTHVGRVRHVYILPALRRRGAGAALIARIIAEARPAFARLQLRAARGEASFFYEALGFVPVSGDAVATHRVELR
jgi:GNAT superfamily N-acetyltransferase